MVQGKKQLNSKPKFAEVVIGDNETKDMRESDVDQKSGAKTEQIASLVRMIFTNYIDIPDMPLDNNDTERLIHDMVMGKKAYILFFLSSGKMRNNKNEFQI